jgi:hypothetical protein
MVELINAGAQPLQNIVVLELKKRKINAAEQAKAVNEYGFDLFGIR